MRRLISRINRVNTVVIDYPVYKEETLDITDIKIILVVGLWVIIILDRSGINGPPTNLSLIVILTFYLVINNE